MAGAITRGDRAKDLQKLRGRDLDGFYDRLEPTRVSRRPAPALSRGLSACPEPGGPVGPRWSTPRPLRRRHRAWSATNRRHRRRRDQAPDRGAQEKDPELATLLFVAATTGCRRGELCGLQWSDVDLEDGSLVVRKSVSDLPGRVEVRTTKTGLVRRMALDPATVAVLEAQRNLAGGAMRCDRSGPGTGCLRLVPGTRLQTAATAQPRHRASSPSSDLGSASAIRFHHLRHFAATVMLAGGVDVRTGGRPPRTLSADTDPSDVRPRHDVTDRKAADILARSITPAEQ